MFSKLYDIYYAGKKQEQRLDLNGELFVSGKPPVRPWYYFLVCLAVWALYPFTFMSGMFYLIIHVLMGEIELPPDLGSWIGFIILSLFFLGLIGLAIWASLYAVMYLFY